jgi:hypothetical protein
LLFDYENKKERKNAMNPRFSQTLAMNPRFSESAFLTNTGETRLQGKNSPGSRGRRRDVEDFYGIVEVPI